MIQTKATLRLLLCAAAFVLANGVAFAQAQSEPKLDCGLSTGQRATGEPIYIGGIVSKTGPDDFSASGIAANAYFRCVNDNGGINGRPVIYTVADDQWNPKIANELAGKLITDRQVIAMVGGSSMVECEANASLYAKSGVIALVGTGVPKSCFHSPYISPLNTGPRISATIAAMYAAKSGAVKRMACIITTIPGLVDWGCNGVSDWGKKNGIAVDIVAFDVANFNPAALVKQMVARNPDVIVANLPKGLLIPLMTEAQKLDLAKTIRFVSSAPAYNPDVRIGNPTTGGRLWPRFWASQAFRLSLPERLISASSPRFFGLHIFWQ